MAQRAAMRVAETPTESVVNSANAIVYKTDSMKRKIGVVRPNALMRIRLFKMIGPESSLNQRLVNELMLAMSVKEIDGRPQIVNTERQLDTLIAELDDAGLAAVASAWIDDFGTANAGDEDDESDDGKGEKA